MVLTVVEQVTSNVSELQRDSLTAQDILHMMVSDQAHEQGAGLYRYIESLLSLLPCVLTKRLRPLRTLPANQSVVDVTKQFYKHNETNFLAKKFKTLLYIFCNSQSA